MAFFWRCRKFDRLLCIAARIPPAPKHDAWSQVLRSCGLRANVTTAAFLEAARHVEARGLHLFRKNTPQAGVLVQTCLL